MSLQNICVRYDPEIYYILLVINELYNIIQGSENVQKNLYKGVLYKSFRKEVVTLNF